MAVKSFIVQAPVDNAIKLFWSKFTKTFCKLDHFDVIGKVVYKHIYKKKVIN